MKLLSALAGGLAGACAVTILHEIVKKIDKEAPRLDLLGMESMAKGLKSANAEVPDDDTLYAESLAGDIASNTIYYSFAGLGEENTELKGGTLGLLGGLGAIYLPQFFGLNKDHTARTDKTKALTTLYYSLGGMVASQVMKWVDEYFNKNNNSEETSYARLNP
jgi:hypothetical protein